MRMLQKYITEEIANLSKGLRTRHVYLCRPKYPAELNSFSTKQKFVILANVMY